MDENLEQLEAKAKELVAAIEAECSGLHTEDVKQLMAVREWKVAIEILCELLLEEKLPLSGKSARALADLATTLGIETKYWQSLTAGLPRGITAE